MTPHLTKLFALLALLAVFMPGQARADKVLNIETLTGKSGVTAWLVQDHTVPVISISFSFDGGLAYDPADKPGVARMVSILLDEGAGDVKSQDYQQQLTDNAISLAFTPGRDAFYGEVHTLTKNKDLAFHLLNMALTRPRFDADAVTRMKNANIAEIKQDMGEPGWLAARSLNGMVFEGHEYGQPGYGTLASMETINRQDLLNYVRAQFARNVLKVSIAGDISKEDAQAALDTVFGALPAKAAPVKTVPAELHNVGKTVLLPLDTPQTYIAAAEQGIPRKSPAWHAAVIMNYILGGSSFDARLMREIRKKRGLTYGVYSGLSNMRDADLLQVNMSCSNDKVEDALDVLKTEWRKMAKDGPTAQELRDAKSYITGSLLLSLTSTDSISGAMNSMQRDGLDADYINRRNAMIDSVTLEDVKRVAAKLLKAENLTIVLVGKPSGLNADIMLDKPPGMEMPPGK
jgi:zinc protease